MAVLAIFSWVANLCRTERAQFRFTVCGIVRLGVLNVLVKRFQEHWASRAIPAPIGPNFQQMAVLDTRTQWRTLATGRGSDVFLFRRSAPRSVKCRDLTRKLLMLIKLAPRSRVNVFRMYAVTQTDVVFGPYNKS